MSNNNFEIIKNPCSEWYVDPGIEKAIIIDDPNDLSVINAVRPDVNKIKKYEELPWDDAAIDADDVQLNLDIDDKNPWMRDDWLPVPWESPWLECDKSGNIKTFFPQTFVERCLLNESRFEDIIIRLNGDEIVVYDWEQNTYIPGDERVAWLTRLAAGRKASAKACNEVIKALYDGLKKNRRKHAFLPDPWKISFVNGVFDFKNYYDAWLDGKDPAVEDYMMDPSPDLHCVLHVPWELKSVDKVNQVAKDYILGLFKRIASQDTQKLNQLLSVAAAPLLATNEYTSQAVYFISDGSSGKSTVTSFLRYVYSGLKEYFNETNNVSDVPITSFGERFSTYKIREACLNITPDSETGGALDKKAMSFLKSLLSGEAVMLEKKNETPIFANMRAKCIINSNELPRFQTSDSGSYGTERRTFIINFNEKFVKNTDSFDRTVSQRIKRRPVIEAFISVLIEHLCEFVKNDFSHPESEETIATMEDIKLESNSLEAFFKDNYLTEKDFLYPEKCELLKKRVPTKFGNIEIEQVWFYQVYVAQTLSSGKNPVKEHTFTREISKRYPALIRTDSNRIYIPSLQQYKRRWRYKTQEECDKGINKI